jgi:hypothetical protein
VVLENVPHSAFSRRGLAGIEEFVRRGGGLVLIGGPSSFGTGGYAGSPLEKALPVWPDPERRRPLALALLIDSSGSMGEEVREGTTKFSAALLAVLPLINEMKPCDLLALITFDAEPTLHRPLEKLDDKAAVKKLIRSKILARGPGGGTDVYSALSKALEELKKADKGLRHVILLSDGKSQPGTFDKKAFNEAHVTISAIATDANPDREKLRELTMSTGGHFHTVAELDEALKDVFIRDLRTVPGSLMREERTAVSAAGGPITKGFPDFPPLDGVNLTSLKKDAVLELKTPGGEPVLAHWRFGAGKAAAFTGSLGNKWGSAFLKWPRLTTFVSNILTFVAPDTGEPGVRVVKKIQGEYLVLALIDGPGNLLNKRNPIARVTPPVGSGFDVRFRQTAPGEYEGRVPLLKDGYYVISVTDNEGILKTTGYIHDHSAEKRATGIDRAALAEIADLSGGRVLGAGDEPPRATGQSALAERSLSFSFIILAGILFLTELAMNALGKIGSQHYKT